MLCCVDMCVQEAWLAAASPCSNRAACAGSGRSLAPDTQRLSWVVLHVVWGSMGSKQGRRRMRRAEEEGRAGTRGSGGSGGGPGVVGVTTPEIRNRARHTFKERPASPSPARGQGTGGTVNKASHCEHNVALAGSWRAALQTAASSLVLGPRPHVVTGQAVWKLCHAVARVPAPGGRAVRAVAFPSIEGLLVLVLGKRQGGHPRHCCVLTGCGLLRLLRQPGLLCSRRQQTQGLIHSLYQQPCRCSQAVTRMQSKDAAPLLCWLQEARRLKRPTYTANVPSYCTCRLKIPFAGTA